MFGTIVCWSMKGHFGLGNLYLRSFLCVCFTKPVCSQYAGYTFNRSDKQFITGLLRNLVGGFTQQRRCCSSSTNHASVSDRCVVQLGLD